jgi:hypothetical protein
MPQNERTKKANTYHSKSKNPSCSFKSEVQSPSPVPIEEQKRNVSNIPKTREVCKKYLP